MIIMTRVITIMIMTTVIKTNNEHNETNTTTNDHNNNNYKKQQQKTTEWRRSAALFTNHELVRESQTAVTGNSDRPYSISIPDELREIQYVDNSATLCSFSPPPPLSVYSCADMFKYKLNNWDIHIHVYIQAHIYNYADSDTHQQAKQGRSYINIHVCKEEQMRWQI